MASKPGPGPIAPVHRITIWTAFLGALAYLAFEAAQIARGAESASWLRAVAAALGVIAIGAYLRNLGSRLNERLTPRRHSD